MDEHFEQSTIVAELVIFKRNAKVYHRILPLLWLFLSFTIIAMYFCVAFAIYLGKKCMKQNTETSDEKSQAGEEKRCITTDVAYAGALLSFGIATAGRGSVILPQIRATDHCDVTIKMYQTGLASSLAFCLFILWFRLRNIYMKKSAQLLTTTVSKAIYVSFPLYGIGACVLFATLFFLKFNFTKVPGNCSGGKNIYRPAVVMVKYLGYGISHLAITFLSAYPIIRSKSIEGGTEQTPRYKPQLRVAGRVMAAGIVYVIIDALLILVDYSLYPDNILHHFVYVACSLIIILLSQVTYKDWRMRLFPFNCFQFMDKL